MSYHIQVDPEWRSDRGKLIRLYVRSVEQQIFPIFDDIGAETDHGVDEAYELYLSATDDALTAYDAAMDYCMAKYDGLEFVKSELNGLAIVGLFHMLERFLREYFERGIRWQRFDFRPPISRWKFDDIRDALRDYGFDIEDHEFEHRISMLKHLANALKHGDGKSREDLRKVAPELFDRDLSSLDWSNVLLTSDDGLMLTRAEFRALADAVEEMWAALPVGIVVHRIRCH